MRMRMRVSKKKKNADVDGDAGMVYYVDLVRQPLVGTSHRSTQATVKELHDLTPEQQAVLVTARNIPVELRLSLDLLLPPPPPPPPPPPQLILRYHPVLDHRSSKLPIAVATLQTSHSRAPACSNFASYLSPSTAELTIPPAYPAPSPQGKRPCREGQYTRRAHREEGGKH
eukprot:764194-Hanusia_phi.AAC.1